jgi:hypothetical protein
MAETEERLPSKGKALSSNPSILTKKKVNFQQAALFLAMYTNTPWMTLSSPLTPHYSRNSFHMHIFSPGLSPAFHL